MRPPNQSLQRERAYGILISLIENFLKQFRINTHFVPITRAAKAQLSHLATGQAEWGEGRKSYANREGFPPTSRPPHAHFTPSSPSEGVVGWTFVHSGIKVKTHWYNLVVKPSLVTTAVLLTLCGCGKWDTSNPMVPISPTLTVGSLFSLPGQVQAMATRGSNLFICLTPFSQDSSTALFYAVDASDPANPKVTGSTLDYGHYGYVYGLALYGSFAYVDTYLKGLAVLDISNPAAPRVLATYDTLATIPAGISGSHLYAVGYGLDYLSLADPVHPKREGRLTNASVSNFVTPWDETRCAFVNFNTYQINIADFSSPSSPRIVAYSSIYNTHDLVLCGGSLYTVTGYNSPAALRLGWVGSDSITQTGTADLPENSHVLTALGNRIVVDAGYTRLFLLSTTGPQSPYVVGECPLPFDLVQLKAEGNRIYANLGSGRIMVVKVTEP